MTDSDSNSSWIMVDEEEDEPEKSTEKEETNNVSETREEVEEVADFWSQIGGETPQEELKPLKLQTENEEKADVIQYKHELVKYERPNTNSSLTSAGFMILGLFIAIYFGNHLDENIISDIDLTQYESLLPKMFLNKEIEHVETYHHQYDHEPVYKKQKKYEYADTKAKKYEDSNKPYKKEYKRDHNDYNKDKYEKDNYKKDYKKQHKKQKHSSEEINYKHKKKHYDDDSRERKYKNEKRKRRDWDD